MEPWGLKSLLRSLTHKNTYSMLFEENTWELPYLNMSKFIKVFRAFQVVVVVNYLRDWFPSLGPVDPL